MPSGPSMRDFYFGDVKGQVIEDASASDSSYATGGATAPPPNARGRGKGPALVSSQSQPVPADAAQETIDSGKQYQDVSSVHAALKNVLDNARGGSSEALERILNDYSAEPNELEVTITQPMRDSQGRPPEKFGIRLISSDEELNALTRDWETASAYFSGIELHCLPTTRRGKRLAVVMGVAAREFNAVIAAERRREFLENTMRKLDRTIEQGRKEMGVDKMPRVPAGTDRKPVVETPAQPKAPLKGVAVTKK